MIQSESLQNFYFESSQEREKKQCSNLMGSISINITKKNQLNDSDSIYFSNILSKRSSKNDPFNNSCDNSNIFETDQEDEFGQFNESNFRIEKMNSDSPFQNLLNDSENGDKDCLTIEYEKTKDPKSLSIWGKHQNDSPENAFDLVPFNNPLTKQFISNFLNKTSNLSFFLSQNTILKYYFKEWDVKKCIRQFLSHIPVDTLEDPKQRANLKLFLLSKMFDFHAILKSNQFVHSDPNQLLSESSANLRIQNDHRPQRVPEYWNLKRFLQRVITYLEYYSDFKQQIRKRRQVKDQKKFAIFNENKNMEIGSHLKGLSNAQLMDKIDLNTLQDFFLVATKMSTQNKRDKLFVNIWDRSGEYASVEVKTRNLVSLLFFKRKKKDLYIKNIHRFLWNLFIKKCKNENLPIPIILNQKGEKIKGERQEFNISQKNIQILKKNNDFRNFFQHIKSNSNSIFEKKIWNSEFKYSHLKKFDLNPILKKIYSNSYLLEYYLNAKFETYYIRSCVKRPSSFCELQTSIDFYNLI